MQQLPRRQRCILLQRATALWPKCLRVSNTLPPLRTDRLQSQSYGMSADVCAEEFDGTHIIIGGPNSLTPGDRFSSYGKIQRSRVSIFIDEVIMNAARRGYRGVRVGNIS